MAWDNPDTTVVHKGGVYPGVYKATRIKDGHHFIEVMFGSIKTRKYVSPEDVTFKRDVKLILVEKVGPHGQVR